MTTEKKLSQLEAFGAGPEVKRETRLQRIVNHFGVPAARHHIFLCTGPDCANVEQSTESWEFLKRRIKELWPDLSTCPVFRTKVGCLRICCEGPICVVYPDGAWYRGATPAVLERILTEHIGEGQIVEDHCFAINPLETP